jgi:hypothetical protein
MRRNAQIGHFTELSFFVNPRIEAAAGTFTAMMAGVRQSPVGELIIDTSTSESRI